MESNSQDIIITYKIKRSNNLRIFGHNFVKNNKKTCTFIYKDKEYKLKEFFYFSNIEENIYDTDTNYNNNGPNFPLLLSDNIDDDLYSESGTFAEITLKGLNKINNISYMFHNCYSLYSIQNLSEINTFKITDMSFLFAHCKFLENIPDISVWNTSNVTNMRSMFSNCLEIKELPDISKWNTSKVTSMKYLFSN